MRGITTHLSSPKSSTKCMTALKKNPDTRGLAPYLTSIFGNLRHTIRAFPIFWTTDGQSSSAVNNTIPRYLKEVIISRGRPVGAKWLRGHFYYLLRRQLPSFLLLPLLTLSCENVISIQGPPRHQNATEGTSKVGEVSLLQYHHGVPEMTISEMHYCGGPRNCTDTAPLNWAWPWLCHIRKHHPVCPGLVTPPYMSPAFPLPPLCHAVLGLLVHSHWTPGQFLPLIRASNLLLMYHLVSPYRPCNTPGIDENYRVIIFFYK